MHRFHRVTDRRQLKISDTALARDLYSDDYSQLSVNQTVAPLRWCAPELLLGKEKTLETDTVREWDLPLEMIN